MNDALKFFGLWIGGSVICIAFAVILVALLGPVLSRGPDLVPEKVGRGVLLVPCRR